MYLNKLISLGRNCFTRTCLTRHKIKCSKSEGELSCPFDLCSIKTSNLIQILKNDFNDFFSDTNINSQMFINTKYNIKFNHDLDIFPNYTKFYDRYSLRIKNLIAKDGILFIIVSFPDENNMPNMVNELYNILLDYNKFSKLLWVSIDKINYYNLNCNNMIIYYHLPNPYPNFFGEWYKSQFYNSNKGMTFEKNFCSIVESTYNILY